MIRVGIVGSSGYVAGELIRCLLHHPAVKIDFLYSHTSAGVKVSEIHEDLFNYPKLTFTNQLNYHINLVFLCLGHGNSKKFLLENNFSDDTKIIDLSNDFRLQKNAILNGKEFVYGLIPLNKARIKTANYIANPGCFATAIQLGLLPLAAHHELNNDIHIHALTGSTGAGQEHTATTHFSWRENNLSIYKPFNHQHLGEINESITSLQKEFQNELNFIPLRGNFTRGIFASMYVNSNLSEAVVYSLFQEFYKNQEFVYITKKTINLKQVVNTNNCLIQLQKIGNKLLITVVIDNLLQGAAGQAIQNMNLMFGLPESTGLIFKASNF
ncbi:MAG: N-acetyl-gamma-glutamyl-phosphate reductase [Bacteroidetes bacterium]|nr:N-acetyl-gamma-glutamyl-phosphate reductase [Bacteroidota bacterium]